MKHDQIFTPPNIVHKMLDELGYTSNNLHKSIFEPSFGDGAFLVEIVQRIMDGYDSSESRLNALRGVFGCEVDTRLYQQAITRINDIIASYGLSYDWPNLLCCDAMDYPDVQCDFVVGNPPYIRIHDLNNETRARIQKEYRFGQGNTDLYIIFFEIGLKHMKEDGKLSYITPNSFLKNSSQKEFRNYLADNQLVQRIVDYGDFLVFPDILTYTAITTLSRGNETCTYVKMQDFESKIYKSALPVSTLSRKSGWLFVDNSSASFLQHLSTLPYSLGDLCSVQYGVATNADKVYLNPGIQESIVHKAMKASTLAETEILFPYLHNGDRYVVIAPEVMQQDYPLSWQHLLANESVLRSRNMEPGCAWYAYARSQSIQTVDKVKYVLKHILSADAVTCEWARVDAGTVVYSGMYLIVHDSAHIPLVEQILSSPDFCRYLKLVSKDMAGGYKTFTTKAVKSFGVLLDINTLNR
jgi:adenine-specific DNA-methyltransferase